MKPKPYDSNTYCLLCGYNTFPIYKEKVLSIVYSKQFLIQNDEYVACEECGFIFLTPRPKRGLLSEYYTNIKSSQVSETVLSRYKSQEYKRTLNFILRHIETPKTIIEVGAASGRLLNMLGKQTKARLIGIEASRESCEYARKNYGIDMREGLLETLNPKDLSADLVICNHTLEHVIDPLQFLKNLSQLAKPNRFVYIEVPSTQLLSEISNPRYGRNIHRLHLNHFLASNLESACSKFGFTPVILFDDKGTNYPSLKALFIKQQVFDRAKSLFIKQAYLTNKAFKNAKKKLVAKIKYSKKKILLWGAGMDLSYVLREKPKLYSLDKITLVDKNPQKQGKKFFGIKIESPENIGWNSISEILITPSNQSLQLHIKEDIKKNRVNKKIKISSLFQTKNQQNYG